MTERAGENGDDGDGESDDTYTAVLDRFERDADGQKLAVLVLERDGDAVRDLPVAAERLPETARHEDAVFRVRVVDGDLVEATYDPDATERRRESAQNLFDRLSERLSDREE